MDRYFITGGTGFIGMALSKRLLSGDKSVNLLVRSPEKARELEHRNANIHIGDIGDIKAVKKAMTGCKYVFHLAALAKPVADYRAAFDLTNIEGTRNVLDIAVQCGVKRVVFTSSAGTIVHESENEIADEDTQSTDYFYTDYDRTKRAAEIICKEYAAKGLSIVIVYPSRVFGPGIVSESNSLVKIMELYRKGTWRYIPGNGKTIGNYVYIDDVVNGHILAMERGKNGEGYILGGENLSFSQLFRLIRTTSGIKRLLIKIPYPLLWFTSVIIVGASKLSRKPPLINPTWLKRYLRNKILSVKKAETELNYSVTPVETGLIKTWQWLKEMR